jgi:hypothetical protein
MRSFCIVVLLSLAGCMPAPAIRTPAASVVGNRDAGKPATLASETTETALPIPAGSSITETKTEATQTAPAVVSRRIELTEPTKLTETTTTIKADTGTVDQSVALRKADNAERRVWLYAAIAAALAGLVLRSMLPAWPGLSRGLLIAAAVFAGAWKFSEVPWWAGLLAIAAVSLVALGYKRAEWDANKNGIPDALEKTP